LDHLISTPLQPATHKSHHFSHLVCLAEVRNQLLLLLLLHQGVTSSTLYTLPLIPSKLS
jgi:hypothetical protein